MHGIMKEKGVREEDPFDELVARAQDASTMLNDRDIECRRLQQECHDLEEYAEHHKDEIKAGDHHDPNVLEVFCDLHPDEPECLVYDD